MNIGNKKLDGRALLAPMAGAGDSAFRTICAEYGCALVTSEMISAKAMTMGDKKTAELLYKTAAETPFAVQLFGYEPDVMAQAAEMLMEYEPDFVDINMGCPAPKITGSGSGSALMKTPKLAAEIVAAVVGASKVPVTVKMRAGWDPAHINAVELAVLCETAGAAAITVHGKTREQMYAPPVDFEIIKAVKQAVCVPVIANGEVNSPESAKAMMDKTGCAAVMVGRGALGHPWLFAHIEEYLGTGAVQTQLTYKEKLDVLLRQASLAIAQKGERRAMPPMRSHAAWYLKGRRGAAKLRAKTTGLSSYEDLKELVAQALKLGEA